MNTSYAPSTSGFTRRQLLKSCVLLTAAKVVPGTRAVPGPQQSSSSLAAAQTNSGSQVSLRDKFTGCIAGCHIGSAMGAPVEGWAWERIEKEHGTLDHFLSYVHYGNGWTREPGTTEDGVERQKLMIEAILEKQDRVNAEDVRKSWLDHMNPKAAGLISEPFEGTLLAMAKTGMPAADIGKYCDYSGLVSLSRSCHPIGLINAGDVDGAMEDVRNVGQLYNVANSRGIRWAEVVVSAIAAATRPGATVETVLNTVFNQRLSADQRLSRDSVVLREIERALKHTADCHDFRAMRSKFDELYSGRGLVYAQSYANEVVTKAICIFRMTSGNTWEAIKAGVNMGRDTDCLTAVAAGISGALSGPASIPPELIAQLDRATRLNPHTCSKRSLPETADALVGAYQARLDRMKKLVEAMGALKEKA